MPMNDCLRKKGIAIYRMEGNFRKCQVYKNCGGKFSEMFIKIEFWK